MRSTTTDIDLALAKLRERKAFSDALRDELERSLLEESHQDVVQLELETRDPAGPQIPGEVVLYRITEAQAYLERTGLGIGPVSKIGNIIAPERNPLAGFRSAEIEYCRGLAGPAPTQIPYLVKQLLDDLQAVPEPVIRAATAHVSIVAIQPFADGNKRSARVVQNEILRNEGVPVPTIPVSERELYLSLLNRAVTDRATNRSSTYAPSEAEGFFRTYIASKVLDAVRHLEEGLRDTHEFTVQLSHIESPADTILAARHIKNFARGTNSPLVVNREPDPQVRKREYLHVAGRITTAQLDGLLVDVCAQRPHLSYDILKQS